MIELLFVTCLSAAPMECRDRSLVYTEDAGLMACMLHGQAEIARWSQSHPDQTVRGWRCRHLATRERKA